MKWRTGKRKEAAWTGVSMKATGKVTPDKVAPKEPTIDTTLMTKPKTGNSE